MCCVFTWWQVRYVAAPCLVTVIYKGLSRLNKWMKPPRRLEVGALQQRMAGDLRMDTMSTAMSAPMQMKTSAVRKVRPCSLYPLTHWYLRCNKCNVCEKKTLSVEEKHRIDTIYKEINNTHKPQTPVRKLKDIPKYDAGNLSDPQVNK